MASTFPQQKDDIQSFLDITSADFTAINGYQNAIASGNLALAQTFLVQIENADRKIISADRLNKIKDALDAVQQFYKTDIQPYIDQKQSEWQNIINQFDFKGRYSSTTVYKRNNIVVYSVNGQDSLYIYESYTDASNIPPNTTPTWRLFTVKGATGIAGNSVDTTFAFGWNPSVTYGSNVLVVYDNKWWISKQENVNQTPQDGSDYWEVAMTVVSSKIPVSSVTPTQKAGELWFRTV